jgi:hypothetical protein
MNINDKIQNVELVINAFGKFPSFHDAEVIRITLEREYDGAKCPALHALIRGFAYTPIENDPDKKFLRTNYDVNLIFTDLFGLKLENFNHQNVLGELTISDFSRDHLDRLRGDDRLLGLVSKQQIDDLRFYVKFEYCFGIEAEFLCESVIVGSVRPVDNPST